MCTVVEAEYEDSALCMESKKTHMLVGALCKKCASQKAEVVLRVKDAYCRECFLSSVIHKFRATLGKSRILKANERILIGVSGSQTSFALLHLVKVGLEMTSHKRLQCTPYVVYIDEGAVLGLTTDERTTAQTEICRLLKKYDFPAFITSLSKSLSSSINAENMFIPVDDNTVLNSNECYDSILCSLFDQVKTLSAKEDLLLKLRYKLLISIAEELKCSKVFVGDTSTDLAVKIMTNLSLGRGAQLPLDVGFCDARYGAVHVIRPIRDFSRKEVAMYNQFNDIESVYIPSLSTKANPYSSIQKLTEKFIIELQTEFPSTVSTIFRTGEKLSLEGAGESAGEACAICQAPLDTSHQISSALQATNFSRLVSSLGPANFSRLTEAEIEDRTLNPEVIYPSESETNRSNSDCCSSDTENASCRCKEKEKQISLSQIMKGLCYGCQLIVREMESVDYLPDYVLSSMRDLSIRNHMREEIKDFLL